ncbi:MAG: hypothetical protein HYV60_20300, partial [Planctomycetia bacterium]|nr:hypothetical protein [Planctomycetia bacterium]
MIAARIGNLATNVLVSGVILIVGLAFGREIIAWWRADSSTGESSPIASVIGEYHPLESSHGQLLEFGDFPFVLNRQEFSGNVHEVLGQLRSASRRAVVSAEPLAREFSPAEQRMIAATKRLAPVEQQINVWSIYEIGAPIPMVVGLRTFESQVATAELRVVSWGIAVPDATPVGEPQSAWTLFTYTSDTTAGATPDPEMGSAPPGGQRTLSLRTDRGDAVVGYAGTGNIESWVKFYDELFIDLPLRPRGDWQVDSGSWRRRFESADMETIDVVIRRDGANNLRSLVLTSPHETSVHGRPL